MELKEFAEPIQILENLKTDYLLARKKNSNHADYEISVYSSGCQPAVSSSIQKDLPPAVS